MEKDHQEANEKEIANILREDELDTIEIEDNDFENEYHLAEDQVNSGAITTA
jgi:hypothetical protein